MFFNSAKKVLTAFLILLLKLNYVSAQQTENHENYLTLFKQELSKKWPNNITMNLVFHGHSVPTGYGLNGVTDRLNAYPFLLLKLINDNYPYSVVNIITTSIGGEQSEQGSKRFKDMVLIHKPDVIFIDYALNDRSIGINRAMLAWERMIEESLKYGTKVILLTPTPDLNENIASDESLLEKHSKQIRNLAKKYNIGLVDSYALFKRLAKTEPLSAFMAQNNHINQKGHQFVANQIFEYFKK